MSLTHVSVYMIQTITMNFREGKEVYPNQTFTMFMR